MNGRTTPPGLCGECAHVRVVESRRGSTFFLCRRSRQDPSFPRYPRLPVLHCAGYRPADPPAGRAPGGAPDASSGGS